MATTIPYHRDIHASDPLCVVGNILAIVPPDAYLSQGEVRKRRYWYKWYTFLVFLLMVCGNTLSLWGRFKYAYPHYQTFTLVITDIAFNISVIITNILTVLIPTFCQLENFICFKEIFHQVDYHLNKGSCLRTKKCKEFYFELILGHLTLLLVYSYDAYVWITELGMTQYRYYIFRDFQTYHLFITGMILYNLTLSIEYRFKELNKKLREIFISTGNSANGIQLHIQAEKFEFYKNVRQITQLYEKHIQQINLFNKIFGWQLLFLTLSIMMGLLNAFNIATVFVFIENGFQNITFGTDLIILSFLWSLWQFLLGTIITVSCNKAWQEAQVTSDVCFGILIKLPIIPESKEEKALQDELTLLSQIVINRCTGFSAAGFFTLDYKLLLAIYGSVTTYLIVLIQFNK